VLEQTECSELIQSPGRLLGEEFGHIRQCLSLAGKALPLEKQHLLSQSIPSAEEQALTSDSHSASTLSHIPVCGKNILLPYWAPNPSSLVTKVYFVHILKKQELPLFASYHTIKGT